MSIRKLCIAISVLTAGLLGSPTTYGTSLDELLPARAKSGQIPSGQVPSGQVGVGKVNIAPIQSDPHGRSYARWAAAWWRWALETVDDNPVFDLTGEHCAAGQSGRVWFLAGSFGSDPVVRTCTIPTGTEFYSSAPKYFTRLFCFAA